ncbi:MAG TPA: hypothetical protein VFI13_09740, partial [Gemmatimonadales bacterium]|nr:hypothetical protein [Gemmatimonadales bacterium]
KTPFLALLLVGAMACDSTSPTPTRLDLPDGQGDFAYTAYSAGGQPILKGTLHLEYAFTPALSLPPQALGGTWSIHWAPGADSTLQVGPQIGSGTLNGVDDSTGIRLSLLPNLVDEGVGLTGLVYGQEMTGTWTYFTIAGPSEHGRFTAVAVH